LRRKGAKEKLAAMEEKVSLDVMAVARLHKEGDELLQTAERLRSKRSVAHNERD